MTLEFSWQEQGIKYKAIYWTDKFNMEDVKKHGKECDVLQVWYPHDVDDCVYDLFQEVITFIGCDGAKNGNEYTYENSLRISEEEIFLRISKNKRYEIRRAENRDGIKIVFVENPSEEQLNQYLSYYNSFRKSKKLVCRETGEKEKALVNNNMFCVAIALDSKDEILAEHGYIVDGKRALLYTSASMRIYDKEKANLIGRANCLLHYKSMLFFKEKGYIDYDFSGAYLGKENSEFISITEFKKLFGGNLVAFRCGFVIPIRELKIIEINLKKYEDEIAKKEIVVWGMGKYGKYIKRRIGEVFSKKVSICIDNKLAEDYEEYKKDDILNVLDSDNYIVLISICKENLYSVLSQVKKSQFFINNNYVLMRVNNEADISKLI